MSQAEIDAGARTPGPFTRAAMKWIGVASIGLSAVILLAQIVEFTTLPDCDSERARLSLLELARSVQIAANDVTGAAQAGSNAEEARCKARLALDAGASIVISYRFFWEGWTQKVEITGVDES